MGHQITRHKEVSEATSSIIDSEVRHIVDRNYQRAHTILKENLDKLHAMAEALMKYETINVEQIKDIMEGKSAREPANWRSQKDAAQKLKEQKELEEKAADKKSSPKIDDEEGAVSVDGTSHSN